MKRKEEAIKINKTKINIMYTSLSLSLSSSALHLLAILKIRRNLHHFLRRDLRTITDENIRRKYLSLNCYSMIIIVCDLIRYNLFILSRHNLINILYILHIADLYPCHNKFDASLFFYGYSVLANS